MIRVSIIIPVLNEEEQIASALHDLERLPVDEVIVVDGGSTDHTRAIGANTRTTLAGSPSGRAKQMNYGAGLAGGDVLVFLHADTRLPISAVSDIRIALSDARCVGGRFDLKLNGKGWVFKLIEALINLRSRLSRVATGDQAIFVRKEVFNAMEGFPDLPLMEDIAFSRMLKKRGRVACLRTKVVASSRRWEKEGIWSTIFKMWWLRLLFLAGVSPIFLKRFYGNTR